MKNLSVAWIMTNHPLWLGRTKVVQGVANVMNYYPWDRQHFAATIGLTIIAPESHSLWIAILLFTNCLFEPLNLINIQTMFQNSKHPLSDQVPDKDKSWPKMSNLVSHIFPLHLQCTVRTDWGKGWKTRSSWLNCALRDDEAVYWVSIGLYEAVAVDNYRTRVRSLFTLVTNWLTHWLTDSLLFNKLYWCDPGVWRCQLKTCWCCNCCWWWSCWYQFVADLEAEVWSKS